MTGSLTQLRRRLSITLVILVQVFFFPAAALADELPASDPPPAEPTSSSTEGTPETSSASTTPTETPVAAQQSIQGPTSPPGPAHSTYTQNPDGTWGNDYYTWNPTTGQTTPKTPQTYSYNPTTGAWDTTAWYYSPEAGKYVANVISTPTPPAGATLVGPQSSIANTGPNSNNGITNGGTNTGAFDLFFDATISNKIGQMTKSGNALVQGNTFGGNATSGDATSIATLLNLLQSSWGQLGSNDISTFVANLDGNVIGDLYIDPSHIGGGGNSSLDVNVASNAAIHNNVDTDVATGDATVSGNTTGGNATTGNARAVVNLLNLINSAISANHSFVGILNINGNFDGDILLPKGMLESVIAATGPNSNNTINSGGNNSLNVTVDDSKSIINNVTTDTSSGDALVDHNTSAGSAQSGNADANVVLLNLTGKKVVAKDAMLVFVNVLGSWVGLIMNAPAGSNAVAATGPNSNNTIDSTGNSDVNINVDRNSQIDNEINVSAHSGDASVTGNTYGGNAKSGDASASVNVLNLIDSQFSIDDWFGVLFINVYGSWNGSFGVNTAAGNHALKKGIANVASTASASSASQTFSFVPHTNTLAGTTAAGNSEASQQATDLATTAVQAASTPAVATAVHPKTTPKQTSAGWVSAIIVFTALLLIAGERLITFLRMR